MDIMTTPQQRDIDRRLRDATQAGLADWLASERNRGMSYGSMSVSLHGLTGDSISDETLRRWCGLLDGKRAGDAA